jgi:hypothetical protein
MFGTRSSTVADGALVALTLLAAILGFLIMPAGATIVDGGGEEGTQAAPAPATADRDSIADKAAFRILAAGDNDPQRPDDERGGTDSTLWLGTQKYRPLQLPPTRFAADRMAFNYTDSLREDGYLDGYRTNLYRDVYVPYENNSIPLSNPHVKDTYVNNYTNPKVNDYDPSGLTPGVNASVAPVDGKGWLPVRNAEVKREVIDGETNYYVSNPSSATVNAGKYVRFQDHRWGALSNVSSLGVGTESARAEMDDIMHPVVKYRDENGGGWKSVPITADRGDPIQYHWKSESVYLIEDHWTWLVGADPGAWSPRQGTFIVPKDETNVTASSDFRAKTDIADYSEQESCTEDGKSKTITEYERFNFQEHEVKHEVEIGSGFGDTTTDTPFGVVPVNNPTSGTLRLTSIVKVKMEHTYGETNPCGDSWSKTVTKTATHRKTRSYPVTATTVSKDDLDIYMLSGPNTEKLVIEQSPGKHTITEYPVHNITVTATDSEGTMQRLSIVSPWRFYSFRTYDHLNYKKQAPGDPPKQEIRNPSLKYNDDHQYLWRDYARPEGYLLADNDLGFSAMEQKVAKTVDGWNETGELGKEPSNYDPRHPMAAARFNTTTVRMNNTDSVFYKTLAGTLGAMNNAEMEDVDASVTDVFGNTKSVTVTTRNYSPTELQVVYNSDDNEVLAHLKNPNKDAGIDNQILHIKGATPATVETNATGWATQEMTPTDGMVVVRFKRTPYDETHPTYYESASSSVVIPSTLFQDQVSVWTRLGSAINELVLIVEWLVFGLFAWWMYRRRRRRGRAA